MLDIWRKEQKEREKLLYNDLNDEDVMDNKEWNLYKCENLIFNKPFWDLINSIENNPIKSTIFNRY